MGALKDINYDLIELLHTKLDTVAKLEEHFVEDAKVAKCHSEPALKKILQDEKEHAKALAEEIRMRVKAGIFD